MSFLKKLIDYIIIIIDLRFWIMNYHYDSGWDKTLNELMKKHIFIHVDEYVSLLGNTYIWVSNYPYACFTKSRNYLDPSEKPYKLEVRPSRYTIYKARKKYLDDIKYGNWVENMLNGKKDLIIKKIDFSIK